MSTEETRARIQMPLTEEQARTLQELAARSGVWMAELIRQGAGVADNPSFPLLLRRVSSV